MSTKPEKLSIGAVSARTGLSADTLRFYEREGLLPTMHRSGGGRRIFTEDDVEWIRVCQRLRASGMPLRQVAQYAALVRAGVGNEAQRLLLLQEHEARVRLQVARAQDALDLISLKVAAYTAALRQGTAGDLLVSGSSDEASLIAREEGGRFC